MNKIFDQIVDRKGFDSLKWDKYKERDVIPMWVADMDFASPVQIREAINKRLDHGVFGYTLCCPELYDVITERIWTKYSWKIQKEWLVILPSAVSGLNVACKSCSDVDSEVATFTPIYPPFLSAPRHAKTHLVSVPLNEINNEWSINFDALKAALTPKTKLLLFCNPHNPVGRVYKRSELEKLADISVERNIKVCSDDIHCDLVLDENLVYTPIASLNSQIAKNSITIYSPAKTFNMAGLGFAVAVIPDMNTRFAFERSMEGVVPHVNALTYSAALAAYSECEEWRCDLVGYLRENRKAIETWANSLKGVSVSVTEASFLAWIDCRDLGVDNPAKLFEDHGVGLSCGEDFGKLGFVRFNFGTSRERVLECLKRMTTAINSLKE